MSKQEIWKSNRDQNKRLKKQFIERTGHTEVHCTFADLNPEVKIMMVMNPDPDPPFLTFSLVSVVKIMGQKKKTNLLDW